jgi:4-hydroxythreonine-4-phosphate dehydrogenase
VLGITMGDPAGIGPELCSRALRTPGVLERCVPVIYGDAVVFDRLEHCGLGTLGVPVTSVAGRDALERATGPLLVDCGGVGSQGWQAGRVSAECGRAAYAYIEHAIQSALSGQLDGVVTAPVHKEALKLAGVEYPGHTEIFTALTGASRTCMMLYSEPLTVSMVTTHVGYHEVPERLTAERVYDVITLTDQAMRSMRGFPPRLTICGLNPHAGEHGLFGRREEERLVQPAVERARSAGVNITGPVPPDTAFTSTLRKETDAFVTLYHDQGHIPFKMLAFDTGVNITLGLPIIRTSVDHGTAFDIAWKGEASPTSLFAAIDVATSLAQARLSEEALP